MKKLRLFGILNGAMTIDENIATACGFCRWVTGNEARQRVHTLSSTANEIMVGGFTIGYEGPCLTVHGIKRDELVAYSHWHVSNIICAFRECLVGCQLGLNSHISLLVQWK